MKIGYPCLNWSIGCKADKTFRLKSYSEERLIETVENNLSCMRKILEFNIKNNILFFRITSELVPFASHPVCKFNWQKHFKEEFLEIGDFIKNNNIRISMHPDQFIVLNTPRKKVLIRSISELIYHAQVLDLMKLDFSAKIQLHIGGAYGDKQKSMNTFISRYKKLDKSIKNRLVIENDDKIFSIKDCFYVNSKCNVPILFDVFHHKVLNNNEKLADIFSKYSKTWKKIDGIPLLDYSSQKPNSRLGSHTETINLNDFKNFLKISNPYDFDVMFEIKDKEKSVLKILPIIKKDPRFFQNGE